MIVSVFAAVLPVLYWVAAPATAPSLHQAGIDRIAVAASESAAWKNVPGLSVEIADLQNAVKLPPPGIELHMNQASASRVPWINSNGWRFLRQPNVQFLYDVKGRAAALAAAEAFCFNARAFIQTDPSGLTSLGSMLKFLSTIPSGEESAVADIGFVDDGSSIAAEVMNLLVRDNLSFVIVPSPQPGLKLTVQLGSKEYPKEQASDPNALVHKIRADLNDARRLVRIYGASVVVVRVTGRQGGARRIHLLNYGAAEGTRVGSFRVRILGHYTKAQLHSFDDPEDQISDYASEADATEFTVPELKAYAVVDLTR